MSERKITAIDIQQALYRNYFSNSNIMMPNYCPPKWWECDFFHTTKSDFWVEHEIKLSVSDFKADAKKYKDGRWTYDESTQKFIKPDTKNKHQELENKSLDGPSRFYFTIPIHLESKIEVPEWAGLKVAGIRHGRVYVLEKKAAPKLHNKKIDEKVYDNIRKACYYRYWNLRNDVQKHVAREVNREKEHGQ